MGKVTAVAENLLQRAQAPSSLWQRIHSSTQHASHA
jgi:hypothetical protein